MDDKKLKFILEYMKSHDPAFLAEFQKRFSDTGNIYYSLLDWERWIFD